MSMSKRGFSCGRVGLRKTACHFAASHADFEDASAKGALMPKRGTEQWSPDIRRNCRPLRSVGISAGIWPTKWHQRYQRPTYGPNEMCPPIYNICCIFLPDRKLGSDFKY